MGENDTQMSSTVLIGCQKLGKTGKLTITTNFRLSSHRDLTTRGQLFYFFKVDFGHADIFFSDLLVQYCWVPPFVTVPVFCASRRCPRKSGFLRHHGKVDHFFKTCAFVIFR